MAKPLMCDPALLKLDLSDKRYIVTGAASGIGLVTAEQLAAQGAEVILACRNLAKTKKVIAELRGRVPTAKLTVDELDLGNLGSVRAFADRALANFERLDGLVNNAGVMNTPFKRTTNGFEMQFGVNHLGHFLLTELLLELLKKSAPSRVVNLSSCYHDKAMGREGNIHLDDLNFERRGYDGWEAYAQSKLANLLHARSLAKRLVGTGVTVVSVHLGWVRTQLIRHSMPTWLQDFALRPLLRIAGMIEPWEGAQTTLHALLDPSVTEHSGEFYSQTGMYRDKSCNVGGWPLRSPNPNAHNDALAEKLWEASVKLTSASPQHSTLRQAYGTAGQSSANARP